VCCSFFCASWCRSFSSSEIIKCVLLLVQKIPSFNFLFKEKQIPVLSESVAKLESVIGKVYNYFNRSSKRQFKFKLWQNMLECDELKFKRIFDIRWSSIRDCIKPIFINVQPGLHRSNSFMIRIKTLIRFRFSSFIVLSGRNYGRHGHNKY
jgi:hypothetical protein